MSASAESLGAGSVNSNTGKPVFISASQSLYTATDREDLSNEDRLAYANIKLQRAIEAISRRDAVYHDLAQENYTGGSITYQVLGTPFPVIEPFPSVGECFSAIRWYEWGFAAAVGLGWKLNLRSSAAFRHVRNPRIIRFFIPACISMSFIAAGAARGQDRLMGFAENEHECDKYGVYDSPENLERKAKNWAKYAAYKEEWMRRYNYINFGERPEETGGFLSACWFKYFPVTYNTRTNYPYRKNPMFLTTAPLRDLQSEWSFTYALPPRNSADPATRRSDDPAQYGRPELSHRYAGPTVNETYYAQK